MLLSLLIPTLENRKELFEKLATELHRQITALDAFGEVEIRYSRDAGERSIGSKRNQLVSEALGKYVAFIDDDDEVNTEYLQEILRALGNDPDCASINGLRFSNNVQWLVFRQSIAFTEYSETRQPPTCWSAIRRSIMLEHSFRDISSGEDIAQAMDMVHDEAIVSESRITVPVYRHLPSRLR